MNQKRISVITGHYGSGKTNFSVNLALRLADEGRRVCVIDIDTVNPYFRTADFKDLFHKHGIRLIAPDFANTNLDIPVLPADIGAAIADESLDLVIDAGGDDAGATVLGCYAQQITEHPYEMFYVYNHYRIHTQSPIQAAALLREIESASRLKVTQIINNSNLGEMTTPQDILLSFEPACKLARLTGVKLTENLVKSDLFRQIPTAIPVEIYVKII